MRIVLVEDENKTRNGIMNMIRQFTNHKVVGTAENGQEGIELVKNVRPDLIISDIRMPVMDGLEMLQGLFDERIPFNAILLTGYSDFEYARKALKLQVADYLLKPLDVEDFLKTLNAVETRIYKIQNIQMSVEQMIANYLERQQGEREDLEPLLNEMLHVNSRTEISLFLMAPRRLCADRLKEMSNCLKELMESLCIDNSHVLTIPGEKRLLVLVAGTEKNRSLKNRFALKVLPELEDIGQCICIYERIHGIQGLGETIGLMLGRIDFGFSLSAHTVIDEEIISKIQYEPLEYPEQLENAMIRELRSGNKGKLEDYGNRFIREVADSNANPEVIRGYAIRMIANVFHVARDLKEHLNKEDTVKAFTEMIILSDTRAEVRYQLEKFIRSLSDDQRGEIFTENSLVMNAIFYIRTHYQEDISLSDVARMCRVTPEYLSKIFFKETGINFSPFLQNFRISAAKRMLLKEDCKVYEVAEAVGFHDQKYFVKVFKKLCGITPSEYRKEAKD